MINNEFKINNNKLPILFFSVGLPGSSKSTWLENHKEEYNYTIHSSDSIRAELGDINDQSKNTEVFATLHNRIKTDLLNGKSVAFDATNLSRKKRINFLKELRHIPCYKVCLLFATPFECCLKNNSSRDRHVPEDVMLRMYKSFETPWFSEGFDDIKIIWWDYEKEGLQFDIVKDLSKWSKISQDNPHHTLSIGDHMFAAYNYAQSNNYDKCLQNAALLHDCGKFYVKTWEDHKGNPSDIAHYYNHENIGSYLSLFYLKNMFPDWTDKEILYVSLLICLHMKPLLSWNQSDKAKEKDRRLFGDEIVYDVEKIHLCDMAAH